MKITPLEIRQKDFEKKLRGFDKDEVNAFLLSLSNEWERVLDESKELSIKLKHAEKEVGKLREVESSLYKTLKTAEDTGANLIDQSNKAAELHMKETQMRAEALMSEAKSKAKAMMEKAEVEARQIIEELQEAVKNIEQNHRDIENHRQNAINELKNLSVDLIEKVERTSKEQKEFRFEDYVKRVKELARESGERIKSENTDLVMPQTPKIEDSIDSTEEDTSDDEPEPPVKSTEQQVEPQVEEPTPDPEPVAEIEEPEEEPTAEVEEQEEEPVPQVEEPEPVAEEPVIEEAVKEDNIVEQEEETLPEEPIQDQDEEPEPIAAEKDVEETQEEVIEEKPGPRIARTVSFFDELDDKD